jgi:S1-C subfamily serine protease
MRLAILFVSALATLASAMSARAQDSAYRDTEGVFSALSLKNRLVLQNALIAAGYMKAVPTERFTKRIFEGVKHLQAENGLRPTGRLDKPTVDRTLALANAMYRSWDLRRHSHPQVRRSLLVPTGIGLQPVSNDRGLAFRDAQQRLLIRFNHFPGTSAAKNYAELRAKYERTGVTIHFDVFKGSWFVFSTTSPSGTDGYLRYHEDAGGITGFAMFWNSADNPAAADRIAVLMSAALNSDMGGGSFVDPPSAADLAPRAKEPEVASLPEPRQTPAPAPSPPPPVTPPEVPREVPRAKVSSGTGFFVSADGSFATNAHVVQGCSAILVETRGREVHRARLLARDETNDLALLKVDFRPPRHANLRGAARLGEDVAAFGFPHSDLFASSGNFTLGNITATSGLRDDSRYFQISAPVHSGNSGGPLLDDRGNVVGVVTAKLNAIKFAAGSGDLPQNVNFAVKADVLATFLRSSSVVPAQEAATPRLERADLAELAREISAYVTCQ